MESSSTKTFVATQQGFFPSADNTAIYYEIGGEGLPLLFCYGLVCRREHWRHQLDYFSQFFKVIVFDYRGHQKSEVPSNETNITLEWCADDAVNLVRHLGLKELVVMGHSMGVPVATLAASKLGNIAKGLVLICGTVTNPFDGMFNTDRLMKAFELLKIFYVNSPWLASTVWKRLTELNRINFFVTSRLGFNPYLAEEHDVLNYMEGVNQTPLKVFYNLINDYVHFDGRDLLASLDVPALVIAGNEDRITPFPIQQEMSRLLKNSQFFRIPMGSHNAHAEVPDMVNDHIEKFLKGINYL